MVVGEVGEVGGGVYGVVDVAEGVDESVVEGVESHPYSSLRYAVDGVEGHLSSFGYS